jgi:outer membrane protein insertion porin family
MHYKNPLRNIIIPSLLLAGIFFATSCVVIPKNYPPNKPFVFKNQVQLVEDAKVRLTNDEKRQLTSQLVKNLDDSMRIRLKGKLLFTNLMNPAVYDTASVKKSELFMKGFLRSQGYYRDSIWHVSSAPVKKGTDQLRVSTVFYVKPGKSMKIDSFSFNIHTPELKALAVANIDKSLLKKGQPLTVDVLSGEIDRLVELYRNNGYYKFTKDELFPLADSADVSLFEVSDPFQQIELLAKAKERMQNPTAIVSIVQKPARDSSRLQKYYIRQVAVYPELNLQNQAKEGFLYRETFDSVDIFFNERLFKNKILSRATYFHKGELYREENYYKTINAFNRLGAWQQVNIRIDTLSNYPDSLNINILLTPAKKQSFGVDLEGSRNTAVQVDANSLGFGVNASVVNRNVIRESIRSTTNGRAGVELNFNNTQQIIQTFFWRLSHSIFINHFILPFRVKKEPLLFNPHTVVEASISYTNRFKLYRENLLNISFGYDWGTRNNTRFFGIKLVNIEKNYLQKQDSLIKLQLQFPALRFSFREGFVLGHSFSFTQNIPGKTKNRSGVFRLGGEISGLVTAPFRGVTNRVYNYIKLDAAFTHSIKYKKTELDFRIQTGAAWAVRLWSGDVTNNTLPFFKQFFAGGPNSMRGWPIQGLGPGSTAANFNNNFNFLSGDIQLEANAEFRFKVGEIAGFKFNSAVFVDMGNIWNRAGTTGSPEGELKLSKLGQDIAINTGLGLLRLDFGYFVIRLDYGLRLKDPGNKDNHPGGWVKGLKFADIFKTKRYSSIQLAVGMPF